MSVFFPRRSSEGLADSMAATGAAGGSYDPVDGDQGFRRVGGGQREIPAWTLSKARSLSVHHYRSNPMARAILDTYTSFVVGDSGLAVSCPNPAVRAVADGFWRDPRNALGASDRQELLLRSHMLMGETPLELLVGEVTGVTRYSYIDPEVVTGVDLDRGNPLWPATLRVRSGLAEEETLEVARIDDLSGLRSGQVAFWADWKALASGRRGEPFLGPVLDWLGAYDQVLWNLVDRTALMRYFAWDVTIDGGQTEIDNWIAARGGQHAPRSGSVEVHNPGVKWEPRSVTVGAGEDRVTGQSILTSVAAGAGLAKTWLAEPEDANRATSLTMAEPVRRRVGGVQNLWLSHMTELVRFAVDQAVAARVLEDAVDVADEAGTKKVAPAETVEVTGPEVAAADAKVNAEILVNLSTALTGMVTQGLLGKDGAQVAAKKAWEDFVGVPYDPKLDSPTADTDELGDYIDNHQSEADRGRRRALSLT